MERVVVLSFLIDLRMRKGSRDVRRNLVAVRSFILSHLSKSSRSFRELRVLAVATV
jgi:hypothetical protein